MGTAEQDRIALVTGASSGFGLLTAVSLAKAGYAVVAGVRDLQRTNLLLEAVTAAGVSLSRIDCHRLDVTRPDEVKETAQYIRQRYGRLDALINNAGFALAGFIEDVTVEELRAQFETNFFGAVQVTKAVLPLFREQRSGCIVMVSSISGRSGFPCVGSYCASKFAMEGWTESLRMEMRSLGVKVVLVEPGAYDTDIWSRNAQIAAGGLRPDSPNEARLQRFGEGANSRKSQRADPREVADQIVRIVQMSAPKLRYLMGKDAKVMIALRRFLPWNMIETILVKASKIDAD